MSNFQTAICLRMFREPSILPRFVRTFTSMSYKDPRSFSTTPVMNQPRSLVKLKKLQLDFQCEDGRPIWLKSGFLDRVLYSSTIVGVWLGLFMNFMLIYNHAKPESWKKGDAAC